jgi:hypothetical protein
MFIFVLFTGQSNDYKVSNSSNYYSVGKEEPPLFLNIVGIKNWYHDRNLVPPIIEPIIKPFVQFLGIEKLNDFADVQVYNSTNLQSENSIGINPLNSANHMISFNELNAQPAFFTTNGGISYIGSETNPNSISNAGDPVAFYNTNGDAYWCTLRSFGSGPGGCGFAKTSNNGTTWTTLGNPHPNGSSSQDDKQHAACDLSGVYPNNVYCAWTDFNISGTVPPISFSRSTDGGVTWQSIINLQVGSSLNHGANISTGPNGEVYVAWGYYPGGALPETGIGFAKSTNGGQSFSTPVVAFPISGIRVTNSGIADYNNTRVNSFPKMDVDRSTGPRRGWIYITYPDRSTGDADVYVRRSTDGGTTWSSAIRINDDAIGNGKQQWMPSIAVDKSSGAVAVGYHNMDTTVSMLTARYMAVSLDGGNTWDRGRVSDIRWTPAPFPSPYSSGYAGDYYETIAQDGNAWTTWSDNRVSSSIWQAYTSKITILPFIAHTPLGNTEQTSGTIPVNCTITPAGSPIDPTKTKLVFGKGGVYTDSLLMTNTSGNSWTANLTLSGAGTYKYYIRTADNLGRIVTAPAGAPTSFYSFTATPDIIPPVITHTQIGTTPKSYWPVTVTANVTDNIGVDSVWVLWYKNTPSIIKEFKLLPTGSNNYSAAFNSVNSDVNVGDVIYYKIMSDDISSNHNVASLPTSGYYGFGIVTLKLCEGFNSATFPPTNWTITGTSTTYWSYNAVSGYGLGTGSARFNYYNLSSGTAQLTTLQFDPTGAGDSLKFVLAHAYYGATYIDTLKIENSTNNGVTWSTIWTLWAQTNFTDPHSLSTVSQTAQFVPTSGQWKTMTYLIPTGTNKLRFNAISGYGNDMFIDSTCIKSAPPAALNFNLTALLSGNYNGATLVPDSVTVELHNSTTPYALVESKTVLLNASGIGNPVYNIAVNGTPYYIVLKFNNGLETWSATPQTFSGSTLSYDFTTAATQAYGSNLVLGTGGIKWCVISGDVNQDGSVDALDRSACWNDRNLSGVYVTDLNGDGVVDALDRSIAWNNRNLSVTKPALAANQKQGVKQDKKLDKNNSKGTKDLKLDGSNAKKVTKKITVD